MSHGSTSVARTSDRLDEHPGTGRGKTIECTTHPPLRRRRPVHGGGDETRNAQAFRTLSSLVHESDSDLRDSLWLSSSRILLPTTIPLISSNVRAA